MGLDSFYITCSYNLYYKPNLIGGKSGKESRYNSIRVIHDYIYICCLSLTLTDRLFSPLMYLAFETHNLSTCQMHNI
jgi:hypothetical protein